VSIWDSLVPWPELWRDDDWPLPKVEPLVFFHPRFEIVKPRITGFLFNIAADREVVLSLAARIRDRKQRMKIARKQRIKADNARRAGRIA